MSVEELNQEAGEPALFEGADQAPSEGCPPAGATVGRREPTAVVTDWILRTGIAGWLANLVLMAAGHFEAALWFWLLCAAGLVAGLVAVRLRPLLPLAILLLGALWGAFTTPLGGVVLALALSAVGSSFLFFPGQEIGSDPDNPFVKLQAAGKASFNCIFPVPRWLDVSPNLLSLLGVVAAYIAGGAALISAPVWVVGGILGIHIYLDTADGMVARRRAAEGRHDTLAGGVFDLRCDFFSSFAVMGAAFAILPLDLALLSTAAFVFSMVKGLIPIQARSAIARVYVAGAVFLPDLANLPSAFALLFLPVLLNLLANAYFYFTGKRGTDKEAESVLAPARVGAIRILASLLLALGVVVSLALAQSSVARISYLSAAAISALAYWLVSSLLLGSWVHVLWWPMLHPLRSDPWWATKRASRWAVGSAGSGALLLGLAFSSHHYASWVQLTGLFLALAGLAPALLGAVLLWRHSRPVSAGERAGMGIQARTRARVITGLRFAGPAATTLFGHLAVSTELLESESSSARGAILEHEQAHLNGRHALVEAGFSLFLILLGVTALPWFLLSLRAPTAQLDARGVLALFVFLALARLGYRLLVGALRWRHEFEADRACDLAELKEALETWIPTHHGESGRLERMLAWESPSPAERLAAHGRHRTVFRTLRRWLRETNLYAGGYAAVLVLVGLQINELSLELWRVVIPFLMATCIYGIDRRWCPPEDRGPGWSQPPRQRAWIGAYLSAGVAGTAWAIWHDPLAGLVCAAVLVVGLAYALPLVSFLGVGADLRLKRLPGMQGIIVASVWAVMTGVFPAIGQPDGASILPYTTVVFALLFINTTSRDVVDLECDAEAGVLTVPQLMGVRSTVWLLLVMLSLVLVLTSWWLFHATIPGWGGLAIYCLCLLVFVALIQNVALAFLQKPPSVRRP